MVALQAKVEKLRTARDEAIAKRKAELERTQKTAEALKQALVVRRQLTTSLSSAGSRARAAGRLDVSLSY